MKLIFLFLLLGVSACAKTAHGKVCLTSAASGYGGWSTMDSAPRDGKTIELLETFGVAPWYGIFKFTREGWAKASDGKMKPFDMVHPRWIQQDKLGFSVEEDPCLFWRPYHGVGKYVDPTHGAQDTVAYECAYMHSEYDKKKDMCK
jgi:hypothetical protein